MRAKKILVPMDLSPYSEEAAREAILHLKAGGKLLLAHVAEPRYTVIGNLEGAVPIYDEALTRAGAVAAKKKLGAFAMGLRAPTVVKVVHGSQAAPVLAALARRSKAELVVMSTHGRGGLRRLLFGSVAQRLLALWQGSVLMLRPAHRRR